MNSKKAKRLQKGQSLIELALVLPMIIFALLASMQLIWIFLAKQVFATAVSYVALFAAVAPQDQVGQIATFQYRIRPVQKELWVLPTIRFIAPNKEISQLAAEYDTRTKTYRFSPEFARIQLAEQLKKSEVAAEAWLQLGHLTVEVTWCFHVKIPLVGRFLSQLYQSNYLTRDQSCRAYNMLGGDYIPFKAVAKAPLHTDWSWHVQE